jgi:signal-transduction protein with cAMP-binding, CBS, and nucleotidyltransferase domain
MIAELAKTPVRELMHGDPVSVAPSMLLVDVVALMKDRYGAILVVDDDELVGIFTERDLMLRLNHDSQDWHDTPVREHMTREPKTLRPDNTLSDALALMTGRVFRHIPITEGKRAVGMLSVRDIITYAVEHHPKEFINLPPGPDSQASRRWGG